MTSVMTTTTTTTTTSVCNVSIPRTLLILSRPAHSVPLKTSTPFVRKPKTLKGRKALGTRQVKVQVHDGAATRTVLITTLDGLYELLDKISSAMKRPANQVEMGYEAPWSSKVGAKKNLAYISNDHELDDFWVCCDRYVTAQRTKKGKADLEPCIVFHNMNNNGHVRCHRVFTDF